MAQAPSKLNKPTPEIPVVEIGGKEIPIAKKFWAWFGALAGIIGNWDVSGNLTVGGNATVTGAATVGSLTATDPATVPANGTLYAADTAWHNVGGVGEPAFQNAFANVVGFATRFRRMTDGTVQVQIRVAGGGAGTVAFQLPAGYRPNQTLRAAGVAGGGAVTDCTIAATGDITPAAVSGNFLINFPADA